MFSLHASTFFTNFDLIVVILCESYIEKNANVTRINCGKVGRLNKNGSSSSNTFLGSIPESNNAAYCDTLM